MATLSEGADRGACDARVALVRVCLTVTSADGIINLWARDWLERYADTWDIGRATHRLWWELAEEAARTLGEPSDATLSAWVWVIHRDTLIPCHAHPSEATACLLWNSTRSALRGEHTTREWRSVEVTDRVEVITDLIKICVTYAVIFTRSNRGDRDALTEGHTVVAVCLPIAATYRREFSGAEHTIRDRLTPTGEVRRATHRLDREVTEVIGRALWHTARSTELIDDDRRSAVCP